MCYVRKAYGDQLVLHVYGVWLGVHLGDLLGGEHY